MAPPFRNHGFMLSFTPGDAIGNSVPGPFFDPGQDLVDLDLVKLGNTNFQAHVTREVGGFSTPIDAEIIGNKIYVLEYSGDQGLWEIRFPPASTTLLLTNPVRSGDTLQFTVSGTIPGQDYQVLTSTNLVDWVVLTNMTATGPGTTFTDYGAANYPRRFYRARPLS